MLHNVIEKGLRAKFGVLMTLFAVLAIALPNASAQSELSDSDVVRNDSKVDTALLDIAGIQAPAPGIATRSAQPTMAIADFSPVAGISDVRVIDGAVVIDAVASGDPAQLFADLNALGLRNGSTYGNMVSGQLPFAAIASLQGLSSLQTVNASLMQTTVGSVDSEAYVAQNVQQVANVFGLDGTGLSIGILSDSFDCQQSTVPNGGSYAADIVSGDLPADVMVLSDFTASGCTDEGRAMAQLVHDLVPGADIMFHTAFLGGQAGFANGIIALADAGADVIVDDVAYFAEPMFADGVIAQAADEVSARGIPYFSSAGNGAKNGYQSPFVNSGQTFGDWQLHDFDPGPGVDTRQTISFAPDGTFRAFLQWTDAYKSTHPSSPGATSDLDVFVYYQGNLLLNLSSLNVNNGDDPLESVGIKVNGANVELEIAIGLYSGAEPALMRYIDYGNVIGMEYGFNAPTSTGHSNAGGRTGNAANNPAANGTIGVAAAFWGTTPAYSGQPPLVNAFSSYGQTPIYYDIFGNAYPAPIIDPHPQITAIDGVNTTFFYGDTSRDPDTNPNFFGTSAAAPNAAAVAILMLQANPSITPAQISTNLQLSAIDIQGTNDVGSDVYNENIALPAGFDDASGAGLIQADVAVQMSISSPSMTCNGEQATIYVQNGVIHGGPMDGQMFAGVLRSDWQRDVIVGTNGNDSIRAGGRDDVVCGFGGDDNLYGSYGDHTIYGGDGNDVINGGDGNDTLYGEAGDDVINGGNENDTIYGGDGNDRIMGSSNDDYIDAGSGDDYINGGNSNDTILAGPGNDTVIGFNGNDIMDGGDGVDEMNGGNGNDTMNGGDGDDIMIGGNEGDTMYGEGGNDTLRGGNGPDTLYGAEGDDVLFGNSSDDLLDGGDGNDMCSGGWGNDTGVSCETANGIP